MKKRNFKLSELENNQVLYSGYDDCGKKSVDIGRVVGCEEGIGVTIVNIDDPNDYLVCISCKGTPGYNNLNDESKSAIKNGAFDFIIDGIVSGTIDVDEMQQFIEDSKTGEERESFFGGKAPSGHSCSFGA